MMEKKKNSKHYIIPASYFQKKGITPIPIDIPKKGNKTLVEDKQKVEITKESKEEVIKKNQTPEPPKIILNQSSNRKSGLSLSSIRAKKEHLIKQMDVVIDEENLPSEPFLDKDFFAAWYAFIEKLRTDGKHNLASILSIDTPKINGNAIHLEFPNATNKVEVERQQYDLLTYIRKTLSNYDINLSITVNEVMEKKYAYTSQDKFEKLMEKNPSLELLRKTFDLDV